MAIFASQSPGFYDDLLLIDSTPVECARSRETIKRAGSSSLNDALANAADYGWCASHSRYFWGFRLHARVAPDGTPRALELCSPKIDEKEVALTLLQRAQRRGGEVVIGEKNYRGREFTARAAQLDATILRPARRDERGSGPHLAPIRQRIESIFQTCKDILTLERHDARNLAGLRERILARFCCLAAAITLNHRTPSPCPRQLHRVTTWNHSPSGAAGHWRTRYEHTAGARARAVDRFRTELARDDRRQDHRQQCRHHQRLEVVRQL